MPVLESNSIGQPTWRLPLLATNWAVAIMLTSSVVSLAQYADQNQLHNSNGNRDQGASLQGKTNGTIGPPGADATIAPPMSRLVPYRRTGNGGTPDGATDIAQWQNSSPSIRNYAPMLPGATNGTISRAEADRSVQKHANESSGNRAIELIVNSCAYLIAFVGAFFFIRRKKWDVWAIGGGLSIIMLLLGFLMASSSFWLKQL